jgi:hypothetical protein
MNEKIKGTSQSSKKFLTFHLQGDTFIIMSLTIAAVTGCHSRQEASYATYDEKHTL